MLTTQTPTEQPIAEAEKISLQATSPRKRRRRAPATGAADDCFACQDRSNKCDRRRPYCTPCLESGKDCSGYKTALTWGVGVASRGKLRGLSLPITNSKRAAPADDEGCGKPESPPEKLTKLGPTRKESGARKPGRIGRKSANAATLTTASTPTNYGFVNIAPGSASSTAASPSFSTPGYGWRKPTSLSDTRNIRLANKKPKRHNLEPLRVSAHHPARDYGSMPMTASIVGGYGHHGWGLTPQISPMVPDFTAYDMSSPMAADFVPPTSAPYDNTMFSSNHLPWADTPLTPGLTSDNGNQHTDVQGYFADVGGAMPMQHEMLSRNTSITTHSSDHSLGLGLKHCGMTDGLSTLVADNVGDPPSLTMPPSMSSLHIGNTPSLRLLIDYYDRVISPVIVTFDGPTNPYRSHILQLAIESETLQHAIAALAASNLRTRRSQAQLSSDSGPHDDDHSPHAISVRSAALAHSLMNGGLDSLPEKSSNEPSSEELQHKAQAIKGLNSQLADPTQRRDDSILASLLILCLYHICDTGVAKFKTQFAGVRKILKLRAGVTGSKSKASNWLTIMFTWFDAMTASVNDRESQLSGDDLGTGDDDEWGLENLAGCDSRLFKTIAKLGRLNLLSQNRPVSPPSSNNSPSTTPAHPLSSPPNKDYYSMSHPSITTWSDIRTTAQQSPQQDPRSAFWREWHTTRHSLQTWSFPPSSPRRSHFTSDHQDLLHISESFRYSALLYTERLASPNVPSSSSSIQLLVQRALYHIERVKSDVFLLWPLFITGTECVDPGSRQVVRERCWSLQRDSGFFNNVSTLQVLERTWSDDSDEEMESGVSGQQLVDGNGHYPQGQHVQSLNGSSVVTGLSAGEFHGNGFRWRKAMERYDGEYIVV